MRKSEALDVVRGMPEEFDGDELIYRLYVRMKVERAEAEIAKGNVIPHDEVVRQSQAWSK